ncbi:hypothetical protein ABIA31_008496 [Catenulispora sp. MAP5-51]
MGELLTVDDIGRRAGISRTAAYRLIGRTGSRRPFRAFNES